MKTGFYPKLAFDGIRKNRRMYVPFICTCIGMVMMFYIISYLHYSDTIASMNGGQIMRSTLNCSRYFFLYFSVLHKLLFNPKTKKGIWSVSHSWHGKTKYCTHFILGNTFDSSDFSCSRHRFWHFIFEAR
mgnify:CR=1 FL=1